MIHICRRSVGQESDICGLKRWIVSGEQGCMSRVCLRPLESLKSYNPITVDQAKEIFPQGNTIEDELYNKFAVAVDIDGIGFSPELVTRLLGNTPLLVQVFC